MSMDDFGNEVVARPAYKIEREPMAYWRAVADDPLVGDDVAPQVPMRDLRAIFAALAAAESRAQAAEQRIASVCADMEDRLDVDVHGRQCWAFGATVGPKSVQKWLAALRGGKEKT